MHPREAATIASFIALLTVPAGADHRPAATPSATISTVNSDLIESIKLALDEERYIDAEKLLNQSLGAGTKDPRLAILAGELGLARGQSNAALASFQSVDTDRAVRAQALQGEGIALAMLGRSTEAMTALRGAVAENPSAWRAWNALGSEFDRKRDWAEAESAYSHALTASGSAAIVLNNRGFSRLLQWRMDDAAADFVAALKAKPDLAQARTNLRLALAMKGEYDRAVATSANTDQAALFNNAGVAAMLRGDLTEAEKLFGQAIKVRGAYYERAQANLEMVQSIEGQSRSEPSAGIKH